MLWFKNIVWYRFEPDNGFDGEVLAEALAKHTFTPCGRLEQKRSGWVSPAADLTDELVFTSNGYLLVNFMQEERILPSSVVMDALNEKVGQIEHAEARKVYRKERTQLKDDIVLELLPRAFTRRRPIMALIAPRQGWIVVNSSSPAKAEDLLSSLRDALGSLRVRLPETQQTPAVVMSQWLLQTSPLPEGIELEDECELRSELADEKGMIKAKGQDLFSPEIQAHLEGGMQVSKLALVWEDQIKLMVHDDLTLHRLKLTDQYQEQLEDAAPEEELAALDTDIAQLGLEFNRLLPKLLEMFGGEPAR